ncbi:MAG: thioredoxin fold domain-containing protein [Terriglobia bacterium]
MEAESYADSEVSNFIAANFVPVEAHIKEHPAWFHRFEVSWTPSVLIFDPNGVERLRIEGYLPKPEFRAHLELGLARVAFQSKKWPEAEKIYGGIVQRYPTSFVSPEAEYWAGVSRYQQTHDPKVLGQIAQVLAKKHPQSIWNEKASIWRS